MIPVFQTEFGLKGNCWQAAVASLLNLTLEDVPDVVHIRYPSQKNDGFTPDEEGCNPYWWQDFMAWLKDRGLEMAYADRRVAQHVHPRGLHLMSGRSPRGLDHTVVAQDGVMVHDPHPDGTGLEVVEDYCWISPLSVLATEAPIC